MRNLFGGNGISPFNLVFDFRKAMRLKPVILLLAIAFSLSAFAQAPATPSPFAGTIVGSGPNFSPSGSPQWGGHIVYAIPSDTVTTIFGGLPGYTFTSIHATPMTVLVNGKKTISIQTNSETGGAVKIHTFKIFNRDVGVLLIGQFGSSNLGSNLGYSATTGAALDFAVPLGFHLLPSVRYTKTSLTAAQLNEVSLTFVKVLN